MHAVKGSPEQHHSDSGRFLMHCSLTRRASVGTETGHASKGTIE